MKITTSNNNVIVEGDSPRISEGANILIQEDYFNPDGNNTKVGLFY
jgi:hypothetical protein